MISEAISRPSTHTMENSFGPITHSLFCPREEIMFYLEIHYGGGAYLEHVSLILVGNTFDYSQRSFEGRINVIFCSCITV